ncbi:MAG: SH3 domain-containing protein [Candidatus Schekmanbacteria bacterium]|nr:SH3 domain-containing protein [Candidatus Schekmanbacteria bacterium]
MSQAIRAVCFGIPRRRSAARTVASLLAAALLASCSLELGKDKAATPKAPLFVVVSKADIYEAPDRFSRSLDSLRYGVKVQEEETGGKALPEGWVAVLLEDGRRGYAKRSMFADATVMVVLDELAKSVQDIPVQAMGHAKVATFLRLAPGRDGQTLEKLPRGTTFEMFERAATLRTAKGAVDGEDGPPESAVKEIWYKVRLEDGRVGYCYTSNVEFDPPVALSEYTRQRRTVAWQVLRSVPMGDLGSVNEYVVAYASIGEDFGADFNRIEVYTWDGGRYQTPFAKSGVRGLLPLRVETQGADIFITWDEPTTTPSSVTRRRFHFPFPYKELGPSSRVERVIGLH